MLGRESSVQSERKEDEGAGIAAVVVSPPCQSNLPRWHRFLFSCGPDSLIKNLFPICDRVYLQIWEASQGPPLFAQLTVMANLPFASCSNFLEKENQSPLYRETPQHSRICQHNNLKGKKNTLHQELSCIPVAVNPNMDFLASALCYQTRGEAHSLSTCNLPTHPPTPNRNSPLGAPARRLLFTSHVNMQEEKHRRMSLRVKAPLELTELCSCSEMKWRISSVWKHPKTIA